MELINTDSHYLLEPDIAALSIQDYFGCLQIRPVDINE